MAKKKKSGSAWSKASAASRVGRSRPKRPKRAEPTPSPGETSERARLPLKRRRVIFGGAPSNRSPLNTFTPNQPPSFESVLLTQWRADRSSPRMSKGGAVERVPPPLEAFPLVQPQPDLSSTGGPQLAPVSPIPDISGLSDDEAVDVITEWFLSNFEDPVQETPRPEGEYLYIWGGPYDARDEIWRAFGGYASEEIIDAAVEAVEREAVDWAPHGSRTGGDPDDFPDEASSVVDSDPRALHAEMLSRIEALEREMAKRRGRRGIGGNYPPDPIETEPVTEEELLALERAMMVLKAQPAIDNGPPPIQSAEAVNFLTTLARRLRTAAGVGAKYAGEQGKIFVSEAIKSAGTEFGKRMIQSPFWWAIIHQIYALADVAHRWLESLGSPF